MDKTKIDKTIEEYLDNNWETMVSDLANLVSIKSVYEYSSNPDTPYGEGPRKALDKSLEIAERMGLATSNADSAMGVVDLKGASDTQLAIAENVDVVDAGENWDTEAFELTQKDGYLLGRGTASGKAALVCAMHAMNLMKESGEELPYSLRLMIGTDKETKLRDVARYKEQFGEPAFLLTSNTETPVSCGEKGMARINVKSKKAEDPQIYYMEAGKELGVIPDSTSVEMIGNASMVDSTDGAGAARKCCGSMRMASVGKSAPAWAPESGENAIGKLLICMLENGSIISLDEQHFFELVLLGIIKPDGSGYGLACKDDKLGDLSLSCSKLDVEGGGTFIATFDVRYPSTITADKIAAQLNFGFGHIGGSAELVSDIPPYLGDASSAQVQVLEKAYEETSGQLTAVGATAGDTYARMFSNAASLGLFCDGEQNPEWVGGYRCPNEGISEKAMRRGFALYVRAIAELMGTEL